MGTHAGNAKRQRLSHQGRLNTVSQEERRHRTASRTLAVFAVRAIVASFACILLTSTSPTLEAPAVQLTTSYQQENCNANDQLYERASRFIEKCRKASIYRVFPAQHLGKTIGEIKNGSSSSHKTAWKLLNDNRFKKDQR
jgi:hypothetical protein